MTLEIYIFDTVKVTDTLIGAISEIEKIIEKYLIDDDYKPLVITIKKFDNKSPPALGINVTDTIKITDRLV